MFISFEDRYAMESAWRKQHKADRRTIAVAHTVENFTPQDVCSTPGQPGSSPACVTCVASCSPDPACIDPAEQLLIDAGEIV